MRAKTDEIEAAGGQLVIVGNGAPEFAASFKKKFKINSPLYVDPSLASYQAAGLKRTKLGTIGPRNWLPALKALFTGNLQGKVQGDPYQQGGVFVIMPDSSVVYSHISKRASDRPKVDKVIKALRSHHRGTENIK